MVACLRQIGSGVKSPRTPGRLWRVYLIDTAASVLHGSLFLLRNSVLPFI